MVNKYGLYVQANGDPGDAAHRTGLAAAIYALIGKKQEALKLTITIKLHLNLGDGIYRRHPNSNLNEWCHLTSNFSRDQASRIILCYAVMGYKRSLKSWLKAMAKRGFFHQNTMDPVTKEKKIPDIMGPGEWRNVIRGLSCWWAYPVLVLLDALFIVDIYTRKKWDGASLYVPDLKFALKKYWTPTAWVANKLNNRTPWLEEVLNNHALENNGCVELQDLFKELAKVNK